jgi:hypothetical protein
VNVKRLLLALSLAGATACSSHGGSVNPPVSSSAPGGAGTASGSRATLSVKVPVATTSATSASKRRPQYVSPSSANLLVAVNGGTATTFGLTQQSPGCAPQSGYVQCTFTLAAPVGNDTFALSITDTGGNVLSRNVVSATIAAGAATPIPVTLAGIPVSAAILPATTAISGTAAPFQVPGTFPEPVEAVALDADGNFIIGPGAPTLKSAVTVSSGSSYATVTQTANGDPNSFTLQPVDATVAGQTVTLSATFTSVNDATTSTPTTVTGTTTYTFIPAYLVASGPFVFVYNSQSLAPVLVTKFCLNCLFATATNIAVDPKGTIYVLYNALGFAHIAVLPAGALHSSYVLDSSNGVHNSHGIAVDKNGTLYSANGSAGFRAAPPSITEYAPGATSPTKTITGTPSLAGGIAVDGSGNIYVANDPSIAGTGNGSGDIAVYPPAGGPAITTLSDPTITAPYQFALDAAGGVYVTDSTNFDLGYFPPGFLTSGTPVTKATIMGTGYSGIGSVLVDPAGNLWYSSAVLGQSLLIPAADLPSGPNFNGGVTVGGSFALGGFIGYLP